jgi:hypothetical protein
MSTGHYVPRYVVFSTPAVKRPLETYRRGSKDNIKMNFIRKRWNSVEWNNMAQDRENWRAVVSAILNI